MTSVANNLCTSTFFSHERVQKLGISWNLVSYQAPFLSWLPVAYALAMCSTALSVIIGSLVSEAKTATEFLPLIFIPQLLFSGFLVATGE